MARYIQNAHMGSNGPDAYKDFRTIFRGASEAPRVHGMLGDKFDRLPRFKNHYFVAFQYTDLNKTEVNPKTIIDVMHRIKSVDAPKFTIDETLPSLIFPTSKSSRNSFAGSSCDEKITSRYPPCKCNNSPNSPLRTMFNTAIISRL